MLIKRYSSRKERIELRKLKNGYRLSIRVIDQQSGDWECTYWCAGIKSLETASNMMAAELFHAEAHGYGPYKIFCRY